MRYGLFALLAGVLACLVTAASVAPSASGQVAPPEDELVAGQAPRGKTAGVGQNWTYDLAGDFDETAGDRIASISLVAGTLPPGIRIVGTTLTGAASAVHCDTVTLRVHGSGGETLDVAFPIRMLQKVPSITRDGVTITFDVPRYAATFTTQGVWIAGDGGQIAIVNATPMATYSGTGFGNEFARNGMDLEPGGPDNDPSATGAPGNRTWGQGYAGTNSVMGSSGVLYYNHARNVDPGITGQALQMTLGQIAVKVTSGTHGRAQTIGYLPIMAVEEDNMPPPDAFRKPMHLSVDERNTLPWLTLGDLDYSVLANVPVPGGAPSFAEAAARISAPVPFDDASGMNLEALIPQELGSPGPQSWRWEAGAHYPARRGGITGDALMRLNTAGSPAEKEALYKHLVQMGLDAFGKARGLDVGTSSDTVVNAGGHGSARLDMAAIALLAFENAWPAEAALMQSAVDWVMANEGCVYHTQIAYVTEARLAQVDWASLPAGHRDRDRKPLTAAHCGLATAQEFPFPSGFNATISAAWNSPYGSIVAYGQGGMTLGYVLMGADEVMGIPGLMRDFLGFWADYMLDEDDPHRSTVIGGGYSPSWFCQGMLREQCLIPAMNQPPRKMTADMLDITSGTVPNAIKIDVMGIPFGDGRAVTRLEYTLDGGQTVHTLDDTLVRAEWAFHPRTHSPSMHEPWRDPLANTESSDYTLALDPAGNISNLWQRRLMNGGAAAVRQTDWTTGGTVSLVPAPAYNMIWQRGGGGTITIPDSVDGVFPSMVWQSNERVAGGVHTIANLTGGQTYRLQVRAVNAAGAGEWSDSVDITAFATAEIIQVVSHREFGNGWTRKVTVPLPPVQTGDLIVIQVASTGGAVSSPDHKYTKVAGGGSHAVYAREVTADEPAGNATFGVVQEDYTAHALVLRHDDGAPLEIGAVSSFRQQSGSPIAPDSVDAEANSVIVSAWSTCVAHAGLLSDFQTSKTPGTPTYEGWWRKDAARIHQSTSYIQVHQHGAVTGQTASQKVTSSKGGSISVGTVEVRVK